MRILIITGFILLYTNMIYSQINAVTETGDQVILYQDHTWKYVNDSIKQNTEININDKEFIKDKQLSFLVKSNKINIGIWINPKEWSFSKGENDDAAEFKFQKKGGDLYAMLISEKIQIPIETLKGIAYENAKNAAPDIKIIKEEYRTVNSIKVLMMQMSGTIQGIKFIYFGYYYSNTNGTIQFITYTSENLFKTYFDDIELFLNGLVEI